MREVKQRQRSSSPIPNSLDTNLTVGIVLSDTVLPPKEKYL